MSERLQVTLPGDELDEIRRVAAAQGMTVSAWARHALRQALRDADHGARARRIAAVRAAARYDFPTGDTGMLLEEIERGYLGRG